MIEKVRSIGIGLFFKEENAGARIAAAYSDHAPARQGVTKALAIERGSPAQAKRQGEAALPLQRDQKRPPHATLFAAFPCPEDPALVFYRGAIEPDGSLARLTGRM
jgi:hypothetical protein